MYWAFSHVIHDLVNRHDIETSTMQRVEYNSDEDQQIAERDGWFKFSNPKQVEGYHAVKL